MNRCQILLAALVISQLLFACSTTTITREAQDHEEIGQYKLTDLTHETDFRLAEHEGRMQIVAEFELDNNRAAADAIIRTVQDSLPADHIAESQYLQLRRGALWARDGEDQNIQKADSVLENFVPSSKRVSAEYQMYLFQRSDLAQQASSAHADGCLADLDSIDAFGALVNSGRVIANRYLEYGHSNRAKEILEQIYKVSRRLEVSAQHLYVCLDMGAATAEDKWFNQAYVTSLTLEEGGWPTVVIATATNFWFGEGDMEGTASWGGRIRDKKLGDLPDMDKSGLWPEDFALLISQYALALNKIGQKTQRLTDTLEAAKAAMLWVSEDMPDWSKPWLEKLDAALLQAVGD